MTLAKRFAPLAATLGTALAITPLGAGAQTPPDSTAIWSLQDENASASTSGLTDRYYVNGFRASYTSGEGDAPAPLARMAQGLWGNGAVRFSIDLSQQIDTPADTQAAKPPAGDRPYAGVLLATFGLWNDTPDTRSMVSLSLGVLGPDALAQSVQNGFHNIIGQGHTNGWHDQIGNEAVGEVTAGRTWRIPVAQFGDLETDALPEVTGGIGNERIYAQTGFVLRLGQGLMSDYGAPRVSPGPNGGDAYTPTRPFAWYVFAGGDGQAVGWDATINGGITGTGTHITPTPLVGEAEAGLAVLAFGARLTYTQVFQSAEIPNQHGGLHQFGVLTASIRF
jgi:lipid A 3-O-deacylase